MVATTTTLFDVKLTEKERKAIERIIGGRVLEEARLEVKVELEIKGEKKCPNPTATS